MRTEIKRQLMHGSGILTILVLQFLGQVYSAIIFFACFLYLMSWGYLRKSNIRLLGRLEDYILKEMKTYERSQEYFTGAATFFLGIFLATVLFPINVAVACIAVLAVGDSISTLIGKMYGKHKLPINKNSTWEGSIAFFIVAFSILWFFDPVKVFYIAPLVTLVEMLPRLDDNLTIPLSIGILFLV